MADTKTNKLPPATLGSGSEGDSAISGYPFSHAEGKRPLKELFGKYKDDPVFDEVWAEILRRHDAETVAE